MFLKPVCNCTIFLVGLKASQRHPSAKWVAELKDDVDSDSDDSEGSSDDENNAIDDVGQDLGCDHLDCPEPIELKTCIVVALSSWTDK